jgi:hypothetical protein
MILHLLQDIIRAGIGFFGLFVLLLLAIVGEAGFAFGMWRTRRRASSSAEAASVSTVASAMLGLMTFLLALTINFSQNRFEARRQATVEEANSIGTAWLRTGLADTGQPLAALIADYARVRLDYLEATSPEREAAEVARTNALQNEIWRQALAIRATMPPQFAMALISSLNDMFDASLVDRYALESRVPAETSLMLLVVAILSIGAVGYQLGLSGQQQHVLGLLFLMMLSGGLTLVVDLSQPNLGFSRVDTTPMLWTIQGFRPGAPTP